MRTLKRIALSLAVLLTFTGLASAAPVVDVQEYPVGFFVDLDANKYSDPYYRRNGEDWGWTHDAIGGAITNATLNISAFDVDFYGGEGWDELDQIYAYDNGVPVLLGNLAGATDIWSFTTFDLGANFFDDIALGLQVFMVIDVYDENWAVTLAKSALSVDGGTLPDPEPGPVPEPSTYVLLGSGLLGVALLKRRAKKQ